jgi:glucokinase
MAKRTKTLGSSSGMALVADIGGTYARFALAAPGDPPVVGVAKVYRAGDFVSVADAARAFCSEVEASPASACFAVAGPVTDDVVEFTNSPWTLDIEATRRALALDRLLAVNDFEALAASVRRLAPADLVRVKGGVAVAQAPVLVVGPGTGFGQALIVPVAGAADRIVPTEGGHVGFAPQTKAELQLLAFLAREHGRVSVERILSGPGLVNIHRALTETPGGSAAYPHADDLSRAASEGRDPLAAKALDLFFAMLGSAVGDAVLSTGARGGVVLGGGVVPKNREALSKSDFIERFLAKGRMRGYVEATPIDLIIREGAALVGAAALLARPRPPRRPARRVRRGF